MGLVKERTCSVCKRPFVWKIARPSDGYWDRWRNDDGNTLANWFLTTDLCWDHAYENMPEEYRLLLKTENYEEGEPEKAAA
jgi:hypothetical protein